MVFKFDVNDCKVCVVFCIDNVGSTFVVNLDFDSSVDLCIFILQRRLMNLFERS